jgi:hypothetical protein
LNKQAIQCSINLINHDESRVIDTHDRSIQLQGLIAMKVAMMVARPFASIVMMVPLMIKLLAMMIANHRIDCKDACERVL